MKNKFINQSKKEKCIIEIVNIIKKYNLSLIDIIDSYINNYRDTFDVYDKIIHKKNIEVFIKCQVLLKNKFNSIINSDDDYVII
jgi:hypothetical protein